MARSLAYLSNETKMSFAGSILYELGFRGSTEMQEALFCEFEYNHNFSLDVFMRGPKHD